MNALLETPLDDAELKELDGLLAAFPQSHSLEELDGLFCALILGPETVGPSEWIPVAFGTDKLVWDDEAQERRSNELLMRHWNTVAQGFREDWSGLSASEGAEAMYFPLLDDPKESGFPLAEGWARGFRAGLEWLSDAHWDALEEDEECVAVLNLVAAFDHGEKTPGVPLTPAERDELVSMMAAGLQYVYMFWRRWQRVMSGSRVPLKAAPTPGRNDACPCGSGNKFKKCCGAPDKLH